MMPLVVSVPHSGTRTLVAYLGAQRHQHFTWEKSGGSPHRYGGAGDVVHIPVRDPMEVARSWAKRGKAIENLLARYGNMFRYLDHPKRPSPVVLHHMEGLPRLAGLNDRDVNEAVRPDVVEEYQAAVRRTIAPHLAFFEPFGYPGLA